MKALSVSLALRIFYDFPTFKTTPSSVMPEKGPSTAGFSLPATATSKSRESLVFILLWPQNGPDRLELGSKTGKSVCFSNTGRQKTDFAAGLASRLFPVDHTPISLYILALDLYPRKIGRT